MYVFATTVALNPAKTLVSVTLPSSSSGGQLHVFAFEAPSAPAPTTTTTGAPTATGAPTTTTTGAPTTTTVAPTTTTVAPTTTTGPVATTTTAPATTTTTTASGSACTNPAFETSAPFGGWTYGGYYIYNNMWDDSSPPPSGVGSQTLSACSNGSWSVVSDQPATVEVKTYPNIQQNFSSVPVTKFSTLTSSFAETDPHVGIYEDAYDMWLNGVASSASNEVMIWNEDYNQVPAGTPQATATFDGRAYTVWATANDSYIAFVASSNFTSGTVNLLEFYDWLINRGWISSSSVVDQIDYGVEVCSTNNAPASFQFGTFSIDAAS